MPSTLIKINFAEAKKYIKEGDVLLFRGTGLISKFIKIFGMGEYSHVAVASWHNGEYNPPILECVEFRENYGGRTTSLAVQVKKFPGIIDVYRPNPSFFKVEFDHKTKKEKITEKIFIGKNVTSCMRQMTGLPYGWKRIWWIARHKLFGIRFFSSTSKMVNDVVEQEIIYPVCSTALAHCFNKHNYDIVYNKSDEYTEPSDFSRSNQLNYMFTLTP